jgi:hypothetical protein
MRPDASTRIEIFTFLCGFLTLCALAFDSRLMLSDLRLRFGLALAEIHFKFHRKFAFCLALAVFSSGFLLVIISFFLVRVVVLVRRFDGYGVCTNS